MKLFVGLGNPGAKYSGHRHNVGFMAVDVIAREYGFSSWRKKFQAETADGTIDGQKVLLLKPQTYMNESGRAVGEAVRFHKLALEDVIVFYDEIDLAVNKLKVKTGGGNAGHNGLRSISHLVGNDYQRVRIGVGHPGHKELVAGYVLHDFSKADHDWLDPLLDAIVAAAPRLAAGDSARFLTDVAQKLNPGKDPDKAPTQQNKKEQRKEQAGAEETGDPKPKPKPESGDSVKKSTAKSKGGRHPAGEAQSKRQTALAANLQKWLKGQGKS